MKIDYNSRSKINSIFDIIHNEKTRIMKKGRNFFIGLVILVFLFSIVPQLLYPLYCLIPSHNTTLYLVIYQPIIMLFQMFFFNFLINRFYKDPYFDKYRIMKKPWPWNENEKKYSKQYNSVMLNSTLLMISVFPLVNYLILSLELTEYITDPAFYPSVFEIFKQTMLRIFVFDTLYYWAHRFAHTSWWYNAFHKQHHEYEVSVAMVAIYNHPIDFAFTTVVTNVIAEVMLVKVHIVTVLIWILFTTWTPLILHCGYNIPWSPYSIFPFGIDNDYHDYHHSKNRGNYALYTLFWDTICGTNKHYWKSANEKEKNS